MVLEAGHSEATPTAAQAATTKKVGRLGACLSKKVMLSRGGLCASFCEKVEEETKKISYSFRSGFFFIIKVVKLQ